MADRDAAEYFSFVFKKLGSDPTSQHQNWAEEIWHLSEKYDFSTDQLNCNPALEKLGLARQRQDPKSPEGFFWFYGPVL